MLTLERYWLPSESQKYSELNYITFNSIQLVPICAYDTKFNISSMDSTWRKESSAKIYLVLKISLKFYKGYIFTNANDSYVIANDCHVIYEIKCCSLVFI